ncbi:MAG: TetR/AcrR family transcriptional regulator, partial [Mycobacterium sp.]
EELDRSDAAVRRRFRNFIVPALAATGSAGERLSLTREAQEAVGAAIDALANLAGHLQRDRQPQDDQEG